MFFRVCECGDVVEVLLDDGSWVLGRIEKIYDGDEKQETMYDIAALDEGYDRRDFFVDPGEFEFPDPPLPLAVGAAVVDLETGRKGRIHGMRGNWYRVQFPYVDGMLSFRSGSLRAIPEDQAARPGRRRSTPTLPEGLEALSRRRPQVGPHRPSVRQGRPCRQFQAARGRRPRREGLP